MNNLQILILAVGQPDVRNDNSLSPKNLREIGSDPQIVHVINSLNLDQIPGLTKTIIALSADECEEFFTDETISRNFENIKIIKVGGQTQGALATACLALDAIDLNNPLLIINGDQVLEHSLIAFIEDYDLAGCDAAAITFFNTHPRWSYVIEEDGRVIEVAEKRPISNKATCGYYLYDRAELFLEAASKSFIKRDPVIKRYFVAPSLNELILSGHTVKAFDVDASKYHSLSTSLDVENYRNVRRKRELK